MAQNKNPERDRVEREIKEAFGFVPDFFSSLPESVLPTMWAVQRDLILGEQTVLDHKTKDLIGLAVSAEIKCPYCTYFHTRAAEVMGGASKQELKEASAVAGATALYSNMITASQIDLERFKRELERALEYVQSHHR